MIALYIRELNIKGGPHKQFFYLADYLNPNNIDFKIITSSYDLSKTYSSFKSLEDKIICIERKLSTNPIVKFYYYVKFIVEFRLKFKNISIINIMITDYIYYFYVIKKLFGK